MMESYAITYMYQPVGKIKKKSSHTPAARRSVTLLLCLNDVTMLYVIHCRISPFSGLSRSHCHVFPIQNMVLSVEQEDESILCVRMG